MKNQTTNIDRHNKDLEANIIKLKEQFDKKDTQIKEIQTDNSNNDPI